MRPTGVTYWHEIDCILRVRPIIVRGMHRSAAWRARPGSCWKRQKKTSESFSLDNEVVTKTNSLPIRRKPFHFICFNLGEIERVTDCGATDFNICASRWVFFLSRSLLLLMCNIIMLTIYLNARNSFDIYIRCVCCYAYLHLVLKFEPYM